MTRNRYRGNGEISGLARKSLVAFAGEAVLLGLSVAGGTLTARLLGPAGFGDLAVVASASGLLFALFKLAMADSAARAWAERSRLRAEGAPPGWTDGSLAGTLLVLGALLGAGAVATGEALLAFAPDRAFEGIDAWTARAGFLFVPAALLSALLATLLQLRHDVEAISRARVAGKALSVALLGGLAGTLWVLGGFSRGEGGGPRVPVAALLWIANAGVGATLACQALRLRRTVPGPWRFERALAKPLLAKGLAGYPGYVALFALTRQDFFLLKALLPPAEAPEALGLYSLAYALAETIAYVGYAISLAVSARVVSDSLGAAAVLAAKALRWIALLSALAAGAMALAAPLAVRLYGGEAYAGAAAPLALLAPGLAIYYLYVQYHALMARLGWFGASNALLASAALANLALNAWLIPARGASGAALATTLSFAGLTLAAALLFHRKGILTFGMLLRPEGKALK